MTDTATRHYHRHEQVTQDTELDCAEYLGYAIVATRTDYAYAACECGHTSDTAGSYVHTRVRRADGTSWTASRSDNVKAAIRKARKDIDTEIADAAILPQLQAIIQNGPRPGHDLADADLSLIAVGGEAFVYAMGRMRRGLVTEITPRGQVEVAYTTATNPSVVYRKRVGVTGAAIEV